MTAPVPPHPATSAALFPVVDLIVPARNEADNVPALMRALPTDRLRRVILCDNGSTDDTARLAREAGAIVVHEPAAGYGGACLKALAFIRDHAHQTPLPDAVAFFDADLADDPDHLLHLIDAIGSQGADLAIGVRCRLAQPGSLTPTQRFGNALAVTLIRWMTGRRFGDLGPMRVVKWSALEAMGMTDRTWGWTVEMQYKAAMMDLRCVDLDVPYRPRRSGRSKISGSLVGSAKAGWKILATLAQLWWTTPGRRAYEPGSRWSMRFREKPAATPKPGP